MLVGVEPPLNGGDTGVGLVSTSDTPPSRCSWRWGGWGWRRWEGDIEVSLIMRYSMLERAGLYVTCFVAGSFFSYF